MNADEIIHAIKILAETCELSDLERIRRILNIEIDGLTLGPNIMINSGRDRIDL